MFLNISMELKKNYQQNILLDLNICQEHKDEISSNPSIIEVLVLFTMVPMPLPLLCFNKYELDIQVFNKTNYFYLQQTPK